MCGGKRYDIAVTIPKQMAKQALDDLVQAHPARRLLLFHPQASARACFVLTRQKIHPGDFEAICLTQHSSTATGGPPSPGRDAKDSFTTKPLACLDPDGLHQKHEIDCSTAAGRVSRDACRAPHDPPQQYMPRHLAAGTCFRHFFITWSCTGHKRYINDRRDFLQTSSMSKTSCSTTELPLPLEPHCH